MKDLSADYIYKNIEKFISWLNSYGEYSQDHQDYYASKYGRWSKRMYYDNPVVGKFIVAPLILLEAFAPSTRKFFYPPMRLSISDAHFAMGFAYLYQLTEKEEYYERAMHFLDELIKSRCPDFEHYCWGYPFNWETKYGIMKKGTPLITITPYAYEAFSAVYNIDKKSKWLDIMHSIAKHAYNDINDTVISPEISACSYSPFDHTDVINANSYRAFLLTHASLLFNENTYLETAQKNLNFVIDNQQENGSWYYARNSERHFIDHFHTCFVLKNLAKIKLLTKSDKCNSTIDKGIEYYTKNLFDENGRPKPFSQAPRLTIYKHELYDYAECVNIGILLNGRSETLETLTKGVIRDLFDNWQTSEGYFRTRKLFFGWNNVPMHRWGLSQIFRSLCLLCKNPLT